MDRLKTQQIRVELGLIVLHAKTFYVVNVYGILPVFLVFFFLPFPIQKFRFHSIFYLFF